VGESRWNYANLDYVGSLHEMPIEDDLFDAVLCTQVLEHLEWPRESVKEMHRVLKPGGKLYMALNQYVSMLVFEKLRSLRLVGFGCVGPTNYQEACRFSHPRGFVAKNMTPSE